MFLQVIRYVLAPLQSVHPALTLILIKDSKIEG